MDDMSEGNINSTAKNYDENNRKLRKRMRLEINKSNQRRQDDGDWI